MLNSPLLNYNSFSFQISMHHGYSSIRMIFANIIYFRVNSYWLSSISVNFLKTIFICVSFLHRVVLSIKKTYCNVFHFKSHWFQEFHFLNIQDQRRTTNTGHVRWIVFLELQLQAYLDLHASLIHVYSSPSMSFQLEGNYDLTIWCLQLHLQDFFQDDLFNEFSWLNCYIESI